jgi:hypothetical protein
MNSDLINKKCWDWTTLTHKKVGSKMIANHWTLMEAFGDLQLNSEHDPGYTLFSQIVCVNEDRVITHVLSLKEAGRILKLSKL